MDIPMKANVYCQKDLCGQTEAVVFNPITDQITHLVVKEKNAPHTQRLISTDLIEKSSPQAVNLTIPSNELHLQDPFIEIEYLRNPIPRYASPNNDIYYAAPLVIEDETDVHIVKHRNIPLHELEISRGANVHDVEGHKVGHVDEFIAEKENGHITLILREGHLFGSEDVSIPIDQIAHIDDENVHLKLTKKEIAALPAVPVKRRWK